MTKTLKTLILFVIACVITSTAFAAPAFQASLAPGIAIHNRNQRIEGFTLSIWGENPQTSFALGVINGTDRNSGGVSLGFINYGDVYKGVQLGFLNADKDLHGAQLGFLNIANGKKTGFQFGLFNVITTNKEWFSNFPNELAPFMLFINWRLEN